MIPNALVMPTHSKGRNVKIDDAVISYVVAGPPEGPALVFIPGWGGDISFWAAQVTHFSKDHRVLAIDIPGFGLSEPKSNAPGHETSLEVSPRDLGQRIAKLFDVENVKKAVLIGHSFGGMISLAIGEARPDVVSSVIGADSFVFMNVYPKQDDEAASTSLEPFISDYTGTISALVASSFKDNADPAVVRAAEAAALSPHNSYSLAVLRQLLNADLVEYIRAYNGSIYAILASENSDLPEFRTLVGERIQVMEIEESSHFIMLDSAAAFNETLESILAEVEFTPLHP